MKIPWRKVSKKEFRSIQTSPKWRRVEGKEHPYSEVWESDTGEAIAAAIFGDGSVTAFSCPSLEHVLEMGRRVERMAARYDKPVEYRPLAFRDGAALSAAIEAACDKLAQSQGKPIAYTESGIAELSRHVKQDPESFWIDEPDGLFEELCLFFGECFVRRANGRWILEKENGVNAAYVQLADGSRLDPHWELLDGLENEARSLLSIWKGKRVSGGGM